MAEESARTVVLVGRTGNGKSATGNSIIGADVFDSFPSSAGVTATCQLHKTVLDNHQILNVIDTPGDYMIVVFAHGDALRKMSLADYLGRNCPEPLMKILEMCGNRYVLFDNMTEDESKKSQQQKELLDLVDAVVVDNGSIPYSNELFVDSPNKCEKGVKFNEAYEELLLEKIESKLLETTLKMEKQLADEQAARKQAEATALEAQQKSTAEMSKLSEKLEISRKEAEEQRKNQIESEKKFKAEQEKLKKDTEKKLAKAEREAEMLRKSQREAEKMFKAEQRRMQAEINNRPNCAIM